MEIEEINFEEDSYPKRLRNIKNPPKKLYVLGNKDILNSKGIAIIGSRDCTDYGSRNARFFGANIANAGFTVISGMAKGIDAAAHTGALEVKGNTIAVLGNGPKYIFPMQNKEIYKKILDTGGVIVSEYPGDTEPKSQYFRDRNRIVSGLSLGVLIVEAEVISGTSITARYAREQGRDIFCIPSAIDNNKGIGTNVQIRNGAFLTLEPKEIIEKYTKEKVEQISIEELDKLNGVNLTDLSNIKEEYRDIYMAIANSQSLNEMRVSLNLSLQELYQRLFMMEMEGLIESKNSKYVIKKVQ